ncbi:MAG: dihydropteroate synthase [Nitrospiraceae bacterium]|nr:dihydropteroate synthase [Nitrospiraceae bacterium]
MKIAWGRFLLDFSRKTYVMGILNVTPDSFSDGGLHFDASRAVERGLRMVDEGADIIDVGGESTRPGSEPLPLAEELRRVVPVIASLSARVSVPISIDTYKAEVARRALDAGASIVNDISGLRFDRDLAKVAAERKVPLVIMHIKGSPKNMQKDPAYIDLIPEILDYLRGSISIALKAGLPEEMIVVDPGIGFGKTFDHNLEILDNLERFASLGRPVLVGPSRKAFIGKILGDAPAQERVFGTAAAVTAAILNGANIVRVHDVKEMAEVAKVADAIRKERVNSQD